MTDDAGTYRFDNLPEGTYTVTVTMDGFLAAVRDGVVVRTGDTQTIDVILDIAPFAQRVEVVGVAPLLGATLDARRVPAVVSVVICSDRLIGPAPL